MTNLHHLVSQTACYPQTMVHLRTFGKKSGPFKNIPQIIISRMELGWLTLAKLPLIVALLSDTMYDELDPKEKQV